MSTRRVVSHLAFASFVVTVTACAGKSASSGEVASATEQADSTDANASSAQASQLSAVFVQGIASAKPEEASAQLNVSGAAGLWPASCVTRTVDPANARVVHVHFDRCTGPFGLVALSGDMTATFSSNAAGGLHVDVTSENLVANGKPVTHAGSGDVTINGTARDIAWTGAWSRLNAKGETVAHTTTLAIVVDTATRCRDVSGTAVTTVADREVDATIDGYRTCKSASGEDECPSGTVTLTHVRTARTLTIRFDGSTEATFTGPRGGQIQVGMVCVAAGS